MAAPDATAGCLIAVLQLKNKETFVKKCLNSVGRAVLFCMY